jgi:BTB/POZ domain
MLFNSSAWKWAVDQHMPNLAKYLLQFQLEEYLCDVTLVSKNGQLKAHSVVLATASSVLRAALRNSCKLVERIIMMPWLELYELEVAIRFIYTGCIIVPSAHADPVSVQRVIQVLQELGLSLPTVQNR